MIVGGSGEMMGGCGWSWVVEVKLWLVVGGGGKLMPSRGWSWVVSQFSNAHMKNKSKAFYVFIINI